MLGKSVWLTIRGNHAMSSNKTISFMSWAVSCTMFAVGVAKAQVRELAPCGAPDCERSCLPDQACFSGCGELIQGKDCALFHSDSGEVFFLEVLGDFAVGDRVFVTGCHDPSCPNACHHGGTCLLGNSIGPCETVPYKLTPFSTYQTGCWPPCRCPITEELLVLGTFSLSLTGSDLLFERYAVTNVDWMVASNDPVKPGPRITGSGTYRIGGEFALTHQLQLDLRIGDQPIQHFDSGTVVTSSAFPDINILVSMNNMWCFDTVIVVDASPVGACCMDEPPGNAFCFAGTEAECSMRGGAYAGDGSTCPSDRDACVLPPDGGPCDGICPRFFYNACSGKCEPFDYGCCEGNANNFLTLEGCEAACRLDEHVCLLPAEVGPCRQVLPRFFYNACTGQCELFNYGGCDGNANNFATLAECKSACKPPDQARACPPPTGACCPYDPSGAAPCFVSTDVECGNHGGAYQGDGTTCPSDPSVLCGSPCEFACPSDQECFSGCGDLFQGVECILFRADSGEVFLLENLGGFTVGDRVFVTGCANSASVSFCMQGNGCIAGNAIEPCGRICGGFTGNTCESDEFCKFPESICSDAVDDTGLCTPVPTGCFDVWEPVCGCNGRTYGNECKADAARVSILHQGPCDCVDTGEPVCGVDGLTYPSACAAEAAGVAIAHLGECGPPCDGLGPHPRCADGWFCKHPVGECSPVVKGVCTPKPNGCPDLPDPVCGCNGVTYGNGCDADAAGVSIAHVGVCDWVCCDPDTAPLCPDGPRCCADGSWSCTGACELPGVVCSSVCGVPVGLPCYEQGTFCKFPEGTCGHFDDVGMCRPVPDTGCPEILAPVCGCDGVTYINECVSDTARVSIRHAGECETATGPDLVVHDIQNVHSYGAQGDTSAFSIGTVACNVGDERVSWVAHTNEHPVIGQNMYRLKDERFEQIGMSWLTHGFYAVSQSACGPCEDPTDGSELGVGCAAPHSAVLNGVQSNMGPRSDVNAHTGDFPYPPTGSDPPCGLIDRRLQAHNGDLDPDLNPGAAYFVESHYVAADEAAAGNGSDNISHRRIVISGPRDSGALYQADVADAAQSRRAAVRAWRDHDPSVFVTDVQVPGEGSFVLAAKATALENGFWRYEYALQNVNSHRSCGSFSLPTPSAAAVGATGFHDVDYHSGEPYDGTDWPVTVSGGVIRWATIPYEVFPNANALRWGTLYNFRLEANAPPQMVNATIGLFRPGVPDSVVAPTLGPSDEPGSGCRPTLDGSDCENVACSVIPEIACTPTAVMLDDDGSGFSVATCECIDFLACHVEIVWGQPASAGSCQPGMGCDIIGTDTTGDGIDDWFTAECLPTGACCLDLGGIPTPLLVCEEVTRTTCEKSGFDAFEGDGTTCEMAAQACCLPFSDDYCFDVGPACCQAYGGVSLGSGSTCVEVIDQMGCPQTCGGIVGTPCRNEGDFCKLPAGTCCCDHQGMCIPVPSACSRCYDPVCGCDGVTYVNECRADEARVSIAHRGECEQVCCHPAVTPPCIEGLYCCADGRWACGDGGGNTPCEAPGLICGNMCGGLQGIPCEDPKSFCNFVDGTCGLADAFGVCTPMGGECPRIWDPVCGCDGVTYSNACSAARVGASIAYEEVCLSGDLNQDGKVNLADCVVLLACMTGPGGGTRTGCGLSDVDSDDDVDLSDVQLFQTIFDPSAVPHIGGYSNSGCKAGTDGAPADEYPFCGDEQVEVTVEAGALHVLHRNATYNCCVDDITLSLAVDGVALRLTEEEVLTTPCFCVCCYDVETTVVDLTAGPYTVVFCWHDWESHGRLCHVEDIVIPDPAP